MTKTASEMPLGPWKSFAVEPAARQLTGMAYGVHTTHPSESGRSIALFPADEWGDNAAQECAQLFAAAPKLLDSLREMVDMFERHIDGRPGPDDAAARWDRARDAIAAAKQ